MIAGSLLVPDSHAILSGVGAGGPALVEPDDGLRSAEGDVLFIGQLMPHRFQRGAYVVQDRCFQCHAATREMTKTRGIDGLLQIHAEDQ